MAEKCCFHCVKYFILVCALIGAAIEAIFLGFNLLDRQALRKFFVQLFDAESYVTHQYIGERSVA